MRWIKDGPDIPDFIVRGVQEGRVVFFCGAGLSQQAGLPRFRGLTSAVYAKLQRQADQSTLGPLEKEAIERGAFDEVFSLLERAIGDPRLIRDAVAEILDVAEGGDTSSHAALIKLATDRRAGCRLVTTNYDRCFQMANPAIRIDASPRLPVPRPDRWMNSIVHLHGFLNDCGDDRKELVLSSADFGAAYLVDGWATRFLRELFKNFTVVFVGYSADDLVVRYMLQALAVDMEMRRDVAGKTGESRMHGPEVDLARKAGERRVYSLAETEDNDERATKTRWEAKGIVPILYANQDGRHTALHQTLRIWADSASRGLLGRKAALEESIFLPPPNDEALIDRVVWALDDETGRVAEHLAGLVPPPAPDMWIRVLDERGLFALGQIPLVDDGRSGTHHKRLHPITRGLARWLSKHLNKHKVLDWALSKGGCVNVEFSDFIRSELDKSNGTVPGHMARVWIYLSDRPRELHQQSRVYQDELIKRIDSEEWNLHLQSQVAKAVEPAVILKRNVLLDIIREAAHDESDAYPLSVEVGFAECYGFTHLLQHLRARPDSDSILPTLLDDCTTALKHSVDVMHYLEEFPATCERTRHGMPHVSRSADFLPGESWMELVSFAVDCLNAAVANRKPLARSQALHWAEIDCLLFKRLTCYAFSRPNLFTVDEAVDYVHGGDVFPLWEADCVKEACDVLVRIWPALSEESQGLLTDRILAGPAVKSKRTTSDSCSERRSDWAIEERLLALKELGISLPQRAIEFLSDLGLKYPPPPPEPPGKEERLAELQDSEVAVLIAGETWSDTLGREWTKLIDCDIARSLQILHIASERGRFPKIAWAKLLEWTAVREHEPGSVSKASEVLSILVSAPSNSYPDFLSPLTYLMVTISRKRDVDEFPVYWRVWDRALQLAKQTLNNEEEQDETPNGALNTPLGRLTDALFEWIQRRVEKGLKEVPTQFWDRMTKACEASLPTARGGRCLSSMRLGWLFSHNPEWTRQNLLPFFDWSKPGEAKAVWNGFLFSPHLRPDLWEQLKPGFLKSFDERDLFSDESQRSLYQLFARIVVHNPEWLSQEEIRCVVARATHKGRTQIAWVFWRNLEASEERAAVLWRERIGPWVEACWQPDTALKDAKTSMMLIRMVLATKEEFPSAVDTVKHRLVPTIDGDEIVYLVEKSDRPERFPEATVLLLHSAILLTPGHRCSRLRIVLEKIARTWEEAKNNSLYRELLGED